MIRRPEDLWCLEPAYAEDYQKMVLLGEETAEHLDACVIAIARNAMPHLPNTLDLVDELHGKFRDCRMYCYENDSDDSTAQTLDAFAATRQWATIEHDTLGGIDSRGFERERTERLAMCRNKCLDWVRKNASATNWTIVLDLDPHWGFSVDGVMNSIGWLGRLAPQPANLKPGAMASYSMWMEKIDGGHRVAQYDSWAARLNFWEDRREQMGFGWFSMLLPPVGSRPIPMNSAFGGLCVYKTAAFMCGGYSGEDCEHVPHHRRMQQAGWQLFLNPGCRYVAVIK